MSDFCPANMHCSCYDDGLPCCACGSRLKESDVGTSTNQLDTNQGDRNGQVVRRQEGCTFQEGRREEAELTAHRQGNETQGQRLEALRRIDGLGSV